MKFKLECPQSFWLGNKKQKLMKEWMDTRGCLEELGFVFKLEELANGSFELRASPIKIELKELGELMELIDDWGDALITKEGVIFLGHIC